MTTHCQINDQTKFYMVEGIDNVFDHMKLCFVLSRTIISSKIGFQEITFITEFPGSNFLLLIYLYILTGGKWGFQVANLLLATINFEPCVQNFVGLQVCRLAVKSDNWQI